MWIKVTLSRTVVLSPCWLNENLTYFFNVYTHLEFTQLHLCPPHQTCSLHLNPFDILPTSPFHPPRTTHCLRNRLSVSIRPSLPGLFCLNTDLVMPAGCATSNARGSHVCVTPDCYTAECVHFNNCCDRPNVPAITEEMKTSNCALGSNHLPAVKWIFFRMDCSVSHSFPKTLCSLRPM